MQRRVDESPKSKEKKGETRNKEEKDHEKIAQQLKEKAEQERRKREKVQDQKILEKEREKLRESSLPVKIKEEVRDNGEDDEGRLSGVDYSPSDARNPLEESPREKRGQKSRLRREEIPKTLQEFKKFVLEPNAHERLVESGVDPYELILRLKRQDSEERKRAEDEQRRKDAEKVYKEKNTQRFRQYRDEERQLKHPQGSKWKEEAEKEKLTGTVPTEGPDFMGTGLGMRGGVRGTY